MEPGEDRIEVRQLASGQLLALWFQDGALQDGANVAQERLVELLFRWPRLPVVLRGRAAGLAERLWAAGFAVRRAAG
jgi:hypothetical protein